MGTETMLQLAGVAGVGLPQHNHHHHHHHQQQHQQQQHHRQHTQPPSPSDGDPVKASSNVATQPQLDVFNNNHPHIHPSPAVGIKFPPVVGIYRPPAARRALKLAEKAFHQLAPPAACENPAEYNHLPAYCATSTEVTTTDKGLSEQTTAIVLRLPDVSEGKTDGTTGLTPETSCGNKLPTRASSSANSDGALGSVTGDGNSISSVGSPTNARVNRPHRERRPDRAVYIPRARRSLTTPPVTTSPLLPAAAGASETVHKAVAPIGSPPKGISRAAVAPHRAQPSDIECVPASGASHHYPVVSSEGTVEGSHGDQKQQHTEASCDAALLSVETQLEGNKPVLNCDTVIEKSSKLRVVPQADDPRLPVEAFKKRSYSLEEHQGYRQTVALSEDSDAASRKHRLQLVTEVTCDADLLKREQQSSDQKSSNASCDLHQPINTHDQPPVEGSPVVGFVSEQIETNGTMHRNNNRVRNAKNVTALSPNTTTTSMIIHDRPTDGEKIDGDEKELRRASQEMNRSNRRIMKQTFNSDVLEIDEPTPPVPPKQEPIKKVAQIGDSIVALNGKSSGGDGTGVEEEEEEDWESMYDDNGDCLNPKMLEELTTAVGKVSIEAPHSDYKAYQTKQAVLNEEEFPHVLEVSNFPVEFKTQDLMMLFSQYKDSGFDIKWVDDTHALAVFSSSKIAAEVLAAGHSFAQVKPLAEATSESRSKARKCASSLQPYRPRPETCAALARRLVTTALGVRLKTAPEERENERRVLREAKERKLLAAKQRDEVWDS